MITVQNASGAALFTFDGDEDSFAAAIEAAIEDRTSSAASSRAPRFGAPCSTLQRRLAAEGVTYAQVLDGVREALAREWVGAPEPALSEVGFRLGFAEFATFSRAFKRWSGSAPGAFRDAGVTRR
ncbi:MAG: helix-turn-helix domain-containing protein [Myxococcaceae bacterium]|nr:helix-turn-helix domain-containing protein [Myxococcaceae bacterium]